MPQKLTINVNDTYVSTMMTGNKGHSSTESPITKYHIKWFNTEDAIPSSSSSIYDKIHCTGIPTKPCDNELRKLDSLCHATQMIRMVAAASLEETHQEILRNNKEDTTPFRRGNLIFYSIDSKGTRESRRGQIYINTENDPVMTIQARDKDSVSEKISIPNNQTPLQTILTILVENRALIINKLTKLKNMKK